MGSRVICRDRQLIYEEAPQAYKSIDSVVDCLADAGLITPVACLRPVLTLKTSGRKAHDLTATFFRTGTGRVLSGGKKALDCLTKEAAREKVSLTRLETEPGRLPDTLRSALVSLDGEKAMAFSERWCGTLLWICTSPYRPHHGRKTGTSALGAFPPTSTYSLMRFVSRLCALPARVGSTLIKPTRQCGPRTGERD